MKYLEKPVLLVLYLFTIAAITYVSISGFQYYQMPLTERPHHAMHENWKPGGFVGHGLGVFGSILMIMLLGYVARKRIRFLQNWGNLKTWLNFHIWMGITGPMLVLFHTSFKFGGIVAVSFWSMTAVALSGVLGRYLYMQIPRTRNGTEISRKELEEKAGILWEHVTKTQQISDADSKKINHFIETEKVESKRVWSVFPKLVLLDVMRPFRKRILKKELLEIGTLERKNIRLILNSILKLSNLQRRIAYLNAAQSMLHHWHIIHRPFAMVMFIIMFVHIVIAILFGYKWIF